jgi:hypothetical protein
VDFPPKSLGSNTKTRKHFPRFARKTLDPHFFYALRAETPALRAENTSPPIFFRASRGKHFTLNFFPRYARKTLDPHFFYALRAETPALRAEKNNPNFFSALRAETPIH